MNNIHVQSTYIGMSIFKEYKRKWEFKEDSHIFDLCVLFKEDSEYKQSRPNINFFPRIAVNIFKNRELFRIISTGTHKFFNEK